MAATADLMVFDSPDEADYGDDEEEYPAGGDPAHNGQASDDAGHSA